MTTFIYKPETTKGPVVLTPDTGPRTPPTITGPDGKVYTGRYLNTNEGRHQFVFPPEVIGLQGAKLSYGGQETTIQDGRQSYEGASLSSLQARAKGSVGSGSSGVPGQFTAGQVGEFGAVPAFVGDLFPKAVTVKRPDYQYIDPIKFGEEFTPYQTGALKANKQLSNEFALDTLDTELKGLQNYVPKSAELKRAVTAEDNTFNQAQRTAQVNSAVPDVVKDLNSVAADARIYAKGGVPDEVTNRAMELGVRSEAADVASSSGFGVSSSAARKVSDLMSARERIQLSLTGESLLGQNAKQRSDLFLAPTEYSNAGTQLNVNPSLSPSQLAQQNFSDINSSTLLSPGQAFSSSIQQSQYLTSLQAQIDQFNAGNLNNFALSYFNYLAGYAQSVAGATQTNINTNTELDQQAGARDEANKQKDKTARGNAISDIVKLPFQIAGGIIGGIHF